MHNVNKLAVAVSATIISVQSLASDLTIEEITVTATKHAATVQEIPYNISAVSGDYMERTGVTDMAKLIRSIPGVAYTDKGPRVAGAFANTIAMRGMNIDGSGRYSDRAGATAPTVATYVGNTPMFTGLRLKDIERVEVLRGPQGTLYGSGAMGGVVRLIQKKPDTETTEFEVSAKLSQTETSGDLNNEVDFLLNLPLADNFAVRANVGRIDNRGFVDAVGLYSLDTNGEPVLQNPANVSGSPAVTYHKDDVNDEKTKNLRVAALWDVSNTTTVTLTHSMQRDEIGGRQGDTPALGEGKLGIKLEEPFERDVDMTSLDIESDVGFATMTVAAATSKAEGVVVEEGSAYYEGYLASPDSLGVVLGFTAPFDLYTLYYGNNPRMAVESTRSWEDQNDTLEVRLASNGDGDIQWVAGLNYHKQDTLTSQVDAIPGRGAYWTDITTLNDVNIFNQDGSFADTSFNLPGWVAGGDENYFFVNDVEFEDLSFFGELTYHVTDKWQVTAGIRHFDQEYTATQAGGLVLGGAVAAPQTRIFSKKDQLFKFNTSYDLNENTMLFFTWAEGFRRGGANALPATVFGSPVDPSLFIYQPDTVESLEVGIKGSLTEGVTYTATAFQIDWDNPQLNTSLTSLALLGVDTGGKAENQGLELEVKGRITDNLMLGLGYSYVDTEMVEGSSFANAGQQLPIPEDTASLSLDYFQDLDNGVELVYHLGYSYRSETPSGTIGSAAVTQYLYEVYDGFSLVDLSVTMTIDNYTLSAFVNNATDERGTVGGNPEPGYATSGAFESVVRPRTFGLGFKYHFES